MTITARLAVACLRASSRRAGVIVVYHAVGDPVRDPERELVPTLDIRLFEAQLRHLLRTYDVVPASQVLAAAAGRRRGRRFPAAVTFDDDLQSHVTVAMPLLRRLGVPAAFFLCGASLVKPFTFWWQDLQTAFDRGLDLATALPTAVRSGPVGGAEIHRVASEVEALPPDERAVAAARLAELVGPHCARPALAAEDVRRLAQAGFEVGFHTVRHDRLPELDNEALERAMNHGREELSRASGGPIEMIAYPHGRADRRVAEAARSAGFTRGFTTRPRAAEASGDPLLTGRVDASAMSVGRFALAITRTLTARTRTES
jgi:peptidoglycan/xylan/chitin deacetylase (PgdA/CDA1 family)